MSNPTADEARADALGYVEQTIYANEDSSPRVIWTNAEVLDLLYEIAERLNVDDPEPCAACDTPLAQCPMPAAGCCSDCTHAANYPTQRPSTKDHANGGGDDAR